MRNSILKYDTVTFTDENTQIELVLPDYTSKDFYNIVNMPELTDETYITYYRMQDDEKIETISYNFYNSTDYWDLILLINGMSPLVDMVYNFDIIESEVKAKIDFYQSDIYITHDLTLEFLDELYQVELERQLLLTEEKRVIKIIKPSSLQSFLKKVREKGYA